MDSLKLHLVLNYYPAIGFVIGLLMMGFGLRRRNSRLVRLALKLFSAMAVLLVAVGFTGEFASWAEVSESGPRSEALGMHKIVGTTAFAAGAIVGIVSIIALRRHGKMQSGSSVLDTTVLLLAVAATALLVLTVVLGRQVKWAGQTAFSDTSLVKVLQNGDKVWHA